MFLGDTAGGNFSDSDIYIEKKNNSQIKKKKIAEDKIGN